MITIDKVSVTQATPTRYAVAECDCEARGIVDELTFYNKDGEIDGVIFKCRECGKETS